MSVFNDDYWIVQLSSQRINIQQSVTNIKLSGKLDISIQNSLYILKIFWF